MRAVWLISAMFLLGSCGGGGSGSSVGDVADNGCTQEFYQTLIGTYTGEILLNTQGIAGDRTCMWTSTVEISGESVLARCLLRSSTSGTVVQSTFIPDDDIERYQCIEDQGERTVREPIGNTFPATELPGLDNSYFPVDISFSGNSDSPDRGPYFGDETRSARYVYLFDGVQGNIVESITANGDGSLTLLDTNGVLLGTLIKE